MNGPYLHLAMNHLPVLFPPVAALLLAGGMARQSRDLVQAGFLALVLVGVVVYPTAKTGGMAAFAIRTLPGIERVQIHEHAEAADYLVWPGMAFGVLSLLGLWKLKQSFPKGLAVLSLLGALFLSVVGARVAHLGGIIRHPEITSTFVPPAPPK